MDNKFEPKVFGKLRRDNKPLMKYVFQNFDNQNQCTLTHNLRAILSYCIQLSHCTFIIADRLGDDAFNSELEGYVADDLTLNGNSLDVNRVLDNLRDEIKIDETIAMKSAMLLKLLEVCIFEETAK